PRRYNFIHCHRPTAIWEGSCHVPTAPRIVTGPLFKLERTIADRAANPREKSYTSQLLVGGLDKIGAKILEEAGEMIAAASEPGEKGREHFVREVADLVYHLLVLMKQQNCTLVGLEAELSRRFGVSGIEEKAMRAKKKATTVKAAVKRAPVTAKTVRRKKGL
ncbi:MAG: phosphoribosyl-ATP diphosphatase, partial [Pirellulales bacterium]